MKTIEFKFADNPVIRQFFKHILTGKDGESYDVGRVIALLGALGFVFGGAAQMVVMIHDMWFNKIYHDFPFLAFGSGFAAMATGCGSLLWLKKDTEPNTPEKPE